MKKSDAVSFSEGLGYPFNRIKGLLNFLWILFPIFGWFALSGYTIRIVQEFIEGKFKELPKMKFKSDMKLGFLMFLKAIPFAIVYVIALFVVGLGGTGVHDVVKLFLDIFVIPILGLNFIKKMTVESYFDFSLVKTVFANLKEYIVAMLKSLALVLIYLVLCIFLIGLPAMSFGSNIFLADFYRRHVKK